MVNPWIYLNRGTSVLPEADTKSLLRIAMCVDHEVMTSRLAPGGAQELAA